MLFQEKFCFCDSLGSISFYIYGNQQDMMIDKALTFLKNNQYEESLDLLNKVLKIEPDNGTAIFLRGMVYARLKDFR